MRKGDGNVIINEVQINASLEDILTELKSQLALNNIPMMQTMKDSGTNIMVCCPYHNYGQERRPSAGIKKADGTFHCFACHEVHTLPEVISHCFGYTDDMFGKQGFKWIMKNFGTVQVEERKDVEIDLARNNTSNKNSVLDNSNTDKSKWVSEEELAEYRYYHKYWTERGITDEDIIELFDLGYDYKNCCITFPLRDVQGNCLFVAKRSVKTKWFNYPKGVDTPLYGLYELFHTYDGSRRNKKNHIFIVESMIDCILLWQAGHYAVALNGTGSELQFEQLNKLPSRHFILATDNDEAGEKARAKIRKNVKNKLITEIEFPATIKDVGDLGKAGRFDDIKNIKQWEVF